MLPVPETQPFIIRNKMKESITKQKKIRYKSVDLRGTKTLNDYLKEVTLDNTSAFFRVKNRQQSVSSNSDDYIFINHISEYKNMVYGELVIIEIGKSQQMINIDDDASEYQMKAFFTSDLPDDLEDKALKREFVESVLYFGVIDNHVAVIQSRALTSKILESYLDWLLGEASEAMSDDYAVILKDTANLKIQEKLASTPTKKLIIGAAIEAEEIQESSDIAKTTFSISDKFVQVFKALLQEDFSGLKLHDGLEDANLRMKLEMTYDRKTSECGQSVIDSVASALRHSDDYKIELTDGTTITADELKLSGTIPMQIIKGNVYTSGLKSQIHSWLIENVDFSS